MKKIVLTDTVFPEGSRRLCVERVHLRVSPGFLQGKLQKIAKNAWKKWTKISTYFNLKDGIKPRDFCGIKNPVIL